MGKLSAYAVILDGNLNTLVTLATNTTTVSAVPGRLIGYYINVTMSAHVCVVKDDTTELFTIPVSLAATGEFFPVGGADGIEYVTSLVVDPDDAADAGEIMFVFQPYPVL